MQVSRANRTSRPMRVCGAMGVMAGMAAACGGTSTNPGFENSDDGSAGDARGGGAGHVDGGGAGDATSGHDSSSGNDGSSLADGSGGGGLPDATVDSSAPVDAGVDAPPPCYNKCSADLTSVVDCNGVLVQQCAAGSECDLIQTSCQTACQAAIDNKQSSGCEYYATNMDQFSADVCFAAFVANTWKTPAHITLDYAGSPLNLASFAFIPSGAGSTLTYGAYDPVAGIPPGQMVILFLAGSPSGAVPCPQPAAVPTGSMILNASGVGNSFHITSDVPVASYEINPYGGGSAAVTGASLLLPISAWDKNYLAVTVTPQDIYGPSMNIVASQNNTQITIVPKVAIAGGGALPAGPATTPYTFTLNKGQNAQFTQAADLTGSTIQASAPIGFMAGQPCMREPIGVAYCDHGEQMIPPLHALGTEYVGVMFRPRVAGDQAIWHMVGAADGTTLTYTNAPPGAPTTLSSGQIVDFITDQPFVVTSQDQFHPFMLFTYMSGSQWAPLNPSANNGYGDPDFVIGVPPSQFLADYVFFADPTYPETNLVIIREMTNGQFDDVTLDCAGVLTGWQTIGQFQWTRADLITHNFQNVGNCSTGRHEISSTGKFGLTVWGWGTPETTAFTANVSYGYPGGMNVQKVNKLNLPIVQAP